MVKDRDKDRDKIKKRLIPYTAHFLISKSQLGIWDNNDATNMLALVIFGNREKIYKGTYKIHNATEWNFSSFKEGLERMDVSVTKISCLDNILDTYSYITHEFIDNTYINDKDYPSALKSLLNKKIRNNKLKHILDVKK